MIDNIYSFWSWLFSDCLFPHQVMGYSSVSKRYLIWNPTISELESVYNTLNGQNSVFHEGITIINKIFISFYSLKWNKRILFPISVQKSINTYCTFLLHLELLIVDNGFMMISHLKHNGFFIFSNNEYENNFLFQLLYKTQPFPQSTKE